MKKLTAVLLMLILTLTSVFSLSACTEEEVDDISTKIDEKITAYLTDLEDSAGTMTDNDAIRDYLCNWAKAKGLNYTVDDGDNVIMQVASSEAYKSAAPTVILCTYDAKQLSTCLKPMAMAMYIAKNNEDTGKLTVIFVRENGHDFAGIKTLSSRYFTDDANVFCISGGDKNMWSVETGARSSYTFTRKVSYTEPTGNKAYRIRIKGLSGGIPDSRISAYPNPIKEMGDLLAYFKTNALIYELASIKGGSSSDLYPKSVSATVVINEDDFDKFQARMEKAINTFNDKYLDDYPEVSYTYEEVKLPKQVMTQTSLNRFVSLLYTLIDGVYYKDGDDLVSITSIGSIKETDERFTISAVGYSLSEENLEEIDTTYKTICGLSDVKYKKTGSQDGWSTDADGDLPQAVAQAFHDYCGKSMEFQPYVSAANTTYVAQLNENCSVVSVTVNEDRIQRYTGTIVTYLLNQPHDEDEEK